MPSYCDDVILLHSRTFKHFQYGKLSHPWRIALQLTLYVSCCDNAILLQLFIFKHFQYGKLCHPWRMDLQLVHSASPFVMCILVCCNLAVAQIVATSNGCTRLHLAYLIRLVYVSIWHSKLAALHSYYHNFSVTEREAVRNGKTCKLPNVCFLELYNKQSDCVLAHHNPSCKENLARNESTCNWPNPKCPTVIFKFYCMLACTCSAVTERLPSVQNGLAPWPPYASWCDIVVFLCLAHHDFFVMENIAITSHGPAICKSCTSNCNVHSGLSQLCRYGKPRHLWPIVLQSASLACFAVMV